MYGKVKDSVVNLSLKNLNFYQGLIKIISILYRIKSYTYHCLITEIERLHCISITKEEDGSIIGMINGYI